MYDRESPSSYDVLVHGIPTLSVDKDRVGAAIEQPLVPGARPQPDVNVPPLGNFERSARIECSRWSNRSMPKPLILLTSARSRFWYGFVGLDLVYLAEDARTVAASSVVSLHQAASQ
jgi:hypothetical protein